jgi:hypothetical protein
MNRLKAEAEELRRQEEADIAFVMMTLIA